VELWNYERLHSVGAAGGGLYCDDFFCGPKSLGGETSPFWAFRLQAASPSDRALYRIEPTLQAAEIIRSAGRPTNDLTAYDLYLRAFEYARFWDQASTIRALDLLTQAIARDPHYGAALALAAHCHAMQLFSGSIDDSEADHRKGIDLAQRAIRAPGNPAESQVRTCLSREFAFLRRGAAEDLADQVTVEIVTETAVVTLDHALAPNAPLVHAMAPENTLIDARFETPDVDAALAAAHQMVEFTFRSGRQAAVPLEARGAVAAFDPATGRITLSTAGTTFNQLRPTAGQCGAQFPHT
jgi:hypothetical protein